jgi:hypothetical protein
MTSRTLLPVWDVYKQGLNLDVKEPLENFDWMGEDSDKNEYLGAKAALDSTPGSREYLKDYPEARRGISSFHDSFGFKLLCKFGSHHSGASVVCLARMYQRLLNDWDGFVLAQKTRMARAAYLAKQLEMSDLWRYSNTRTMLSADKVNPILLNEYREKYKVSYDDSTMIQMLDALIDEKAADRLEEQNKVAREVLEGRIQVLDHHYEHPSRWNDSPSGSALFGSPRNITEEMFVEMEKKYPNYRAHIAAVIKASSKN